MKVAVIDMGTNTFHLMIVEIHEGGFTFLHRERNPVKIGENGINEGYISEAAMERAKKAILAFKVIIDSHQVDQIKATATSAIRNAKNGSKLALEIEALTGIKIRIISGLEEAELIYFGVQQALDIGDKPALIMDIGGGSIEFVIGTGEKILWKQSFEIGGQRLLERFHRTDPITDLEVHSLNHYLDSELQELVRQAEKFSPSALIGSSGTFDTLSDIYLQSTGAEKGDHTTEFPLTYEAFQSIYNALTSTDRAGRLAIPGMIPMRVDMIVVASILVRYVLERLNLREIRVSAYALKEGVLLHSIKNQVGISPEVES
ncbi:MAG: Ppx/GppA phosphatase family protein [Bacteroidota bacterium]